MAGDDYTTLRAKFLKAFANLPEKAKSEEVIAVEDEKPYTWFATAIEVKSESVTGKKILKILERMSII
jgi:hypothetical protein